MQNRRQPFRDNIRMMTDDLLAARRRQQFSVEEHEEQFPWDACLWLALATATIIFVGMVWFGW